MKYEKRLHQDGRIYGKYKLKPNRIIELEDFKRMLNDKRLTNGHKPLFKHKTRDKAFCTLLFLCGLRKMEATKIIKEDMVIDKTYVFFVVPAFKHGERGGRLKLKRSNPGVEYIVSLWRKIRRGKPLFPFSDSTAYRIVIRAFGVCPHWLRHNFITRMQRLEGTSSDVDRKIMAWTGIKFRGTLDKYRLKTEKDIDEVAEAIEI